MNSYIHTKVIKYIFLSLGILFQVKLQKLVPEYGSSV